MSCRNNILERARLHCKVMCLESLTGIIGGVALHVGGVLLCKVR